MHFQTKTSHSFKWKHKNTRASSRFFASSNVATILLSFSKKRKHLQYFSKCTFCIQSMLKLVLRTISLMHAKIQKHSAPTAHTRVKTWAHNTTNTSTCIAIRFWQFTLYITTQTNFMCKFVKMFEKHENFTLPDKFKGCHKCMIMKSSMKLKRKWLLQLGTLDIFLFNWKIPYNSTCQKWIKSLAFLVWVFHHLTIIPQAL